MKKRTLVILLIIPFIISLLTFVSVQILDNQVAVDINGIKINYTGNVGFQVSDIKTYSLEATKIINDPNQIIANGNNLYWRVENVDSTDEIVHATLVNTGDGLASLTALEEGKVKVICSNERNTVENSFNATIYRDGALVINPEIEQSGSKIDSTIYYGDSDLSYSDVRKGSASEVNATFKLTTIAYGENTTVENQATLLDCSENITYKDGVVTINKDYINDDKQVESYVTLESTVENSTYSETFTFTVIDGVNIHSYNDLLMATNYSTSPSNIVMQTNLEPLSALYQQDEKGNYIETKLESAKNNSSLFGNYDFTNQTFNFKNEYYTFDTTYDSSYIDLYNNSVSKDKQVSKQVIAGIHITKDVYGNGFTINMNDLCFPTHGSINDDGKLEPDPELDYFHGPLPFVGVGDLSSYPLIVALGQDNSGFYIDSDNVTINDLKLSNVNEDDNVYNYTYTGSVIDIKANNVTIKNSIIQNGKVCVRAFDSDNLLIDNCILKNSGEFSLMVGSDKRNSYDTSKVVNETFDGKQVNKSFSDFFDKLEGEEGGDNSADSRYNALITATLSGSEALNSYDYASDLRKIQNYLDNTNGFYNSDNSVNYAANIVVNNTLFGRSGIFSIASESSFNGGFLYGKIPSQLCSLLSMLTKVLPSKNGGTSYPVHVTLSGDTRFYDWKSIDSIDVSALIQQNISKLMSSESLKNLLNGKTFTIDDIFPMKRALLEQASKQGLCYTYKDTKYLNTAIAYYGGGLNVSKIDNSALEESSYNTYSSEIEVDMTEQIIKSANSTGKLTAALVDAVVVTIGAHPFRFITNGASESTSPILFDTEKGESKSPDLTILQANAK